MEILNKNYYSLNSLQNENSFTYFIFEFKGHQTRICGIFKSIYIYIYIYEIYINYESPVNLQ